MILLDDFKRLKTGTMIIFHVANKIGFVTSRTKDRITIFDNLGIQKSYDRFSLERCDILRFDKPEEFIYQYLQALKDDDLSIRIGEVMRSMGVDSLEKAMELKYSKTQTVRPEDIMHEEQVNNCNMKAASCENAPYKYHYSHMVNEEALITAFEEANNTTKYNSEGIYYRENFNGYDSQNGIALEAKNEINKNTEAIELIGRKVLEIEAKCSYVAELLEEVEAIDNDDTDGII